MPLEDDESDSEYAENITGQTLLNLSPLIFTYDYRKLALLRFLLEILIPTCIALYISQEMHPYPRFLFFCVFSSCHFIFGCMAHLDALRATRQVNRRSSRRLTLSST